jgi:hypothetical protein
MEGVSSPFSYKKKPVSNGMPEPRVPDRESQMRLMDLVLEPSQSGPVYMSWDLPPSQDHVRTIVRRESPHVLADYCNLDQNSSSRDISR